MKSRFELLPLLSIFATFMSVKKWMNNYINLINSRRQLLNGYNLGALLFTTQELDCIGALSFFFVRRFDTIFMTLIFQNGINR